MGFARNVAKDAVAPVEAALNRVLTDVFPKVTELVDHTVDQLEARTRRVIDDVLPRVGTLVDDTVGQVEQRADAIVEKSLATSFAYVDRTIVAAQHHLEQSIETAGAELRSTASHAVEQLDAAVEKRIRHLEGQSVRALEEAVRRSVEESAKTTRQEIDAVVRSVQRLLVGLAVPIPATVYAVFAVMHGAPRGMVVAWALGLLAATSASLALFERLRRTSLGGDRCRWRDVLIDLAPYTAVGGLLASAVVLAP